MDRATLARLVGVVAPAVATATVAVWLLQDVLGVRNPSAVYLVAVSVAAFVAGTPGGIVASVASFLLYDFLFVEPRYTWTVADPGEWLNLVLLLFVGVVVGQLAALQRSRANDARAREREARALFTATRTLVTRESALEALPSLAGILREATGLERVWITLGVDDPRQRVVADTGTGPPPGDGPFHLVLRRMPGDVPAEWVRVHRPGARRGREVTGREVTGREATGRVPYRVWIEAGSDRLGSIWATAAGDEGRLDRSVTRLLSAAADQVAQALVHDRLASEAHAAEVARQADALKSALLQSVSHDLRTPLATIRAAAGTLRPSIGLGDEDRNANVDAIDREVDYLNRLVTNLLDLSRIEAGSLRADRDAFVLEDLLERALARARVRLGVRPLTVELRAPAVEVDPVFLDEAVTNALDNVAKYTPEAAPVRVAADELPGEPFVRLTVEDGGPGVPDEELPRIFEKFYRVPGRQRTSRSGTGIGLAVTRGLVEAMGGRVRARRSDLGGLAIDLDLPLASVPSVEREGRGE